MGATAAAGSAGDDRIGGLGSSRARRVVEVQVQVNDESAVLTVRSVGRRGMQVRELRAPTTTAEHAASAVARHYGLVRTARNCWQAVEHLDAPPTAG